MAVENVVRCAMTVMYRVTTGDFSKSLFFELFNSRQLEEM